MSIHEIKDEKANSFSTPFITKKSGINRNRILNIEKITLIEELIKCAICNEIQINHMNVKIVVLYFVKNV